MTRTEIYKLYEALDLPDFSLRMRPDDANYYFASNGDDEDGDKSYCYLVMGIEGVPYAIEYVPHSAHYMDTMAKVVKRLSKIEKKINQIKRALR